MQQMSVVVLQPPPTEGMKRPRKADRDGVTSPLFSSHFIFFQLVPVQQLSFIKEFALFLQVILTLQGIGTEMFLLVLCVSLSLRLLPFFSLSSWLVLSACPCLSACLCLSLSMSLCRSVPLFFYVCLSLSLLSFSVFLSLRVHIFPSLPCHSLKYLSGIIYSLSKFIHY